MVSYLTYNLEDNESSHILPQPCNRMMKLSILLSRQYTLSSQVLSSRKWVLCHWWQITTRLKNNYSSEQWLLYIISVSMVYPWVKSKTHCRFQILSVMYYVKTVLGYLGSNFIIRIFHLCYIHSLEYMKTEWMDKNSSKETCPSIYCH